MIVSHPFSTLAGTSGTNANPQHISSLLRDVALFCLTVWVKGHYMGKNRELQHNLNDEAHKLAHSFVPHLDYYPMDWSHPSNFVSQNLRHYLTYKWQEHILEELHSPALQATTCKNTSWSTHQFFMVHWVALKHCLVSMPRTTQISYRKLIHGLLNTNAQNKKYYKVSDLCPHCNHLPETFSHILHCGNPDVAAHRLVQQNTSGRTWRGFIL